MVAFKGDIRYNYIQKTFAEEIGEVTFSMGMEQYEARYILTMFVQRRGPAWSYLQNGSESKSSSFADRRAS